MGLKLCFFTKINKKILPLLTLFTTFKILFMKNIIIYFLLFVIFTKVSAQKPASIIGNSFYDANDKLVFTLPSGHQLSNESERSKNLK